jgi:hypothetical protein
MVPFAEWRRRRFCYCRRHSAKGTINRGHQPPTPFVTFVLPTSALRFARPFPAHQT